jgi:hypothetical protein
MRRRRAVPYPRERRVGLGRIVRRCTTSAASPSPPKARQIGSANGGRVELSLGPLLTVPVGGGVVVRPDVGDELAAEIGEVKHVVVIVFPSRVTAPVLASARPCTTAPVVIVTEA